MSNVKESAILTWKIKNYYCATRHKSPVIDFPETKNQFTLCLFTNQSWVDIYHDFIRIRYYGNENVLNLRYRISIINQNGDKCHTKGVLYI